MTTYTNLITVGSKLQYADSVSSFMMKRTLDFSVTGYTAADVIQLFHIPAKVFVAKVMWDVTTAEGGTFTFDIGDGGDVDGYIDGADGNAVGNGSSLIVLTEATPNTITGYSNGKYYSAADTLDLLVNNTVDAGVMTVKALCYDFS